jgi:uncharacterized protein
VPTYLTPGVYVEELPSGSMPLHAVGTAVAAFVGFTERGPTDDPRDPQGVRPRLVTNWTQFTTLYGGFVEGAMLAHAVYGFFNNGGSAAYIARVPHTVLGSGGARKALPSGAGNDKPSLEITSSVEGSDVEVVVTPTGTDEAPTFDLTVQVDGAVVETYPDLTLAKGDRNVESVVNETSTRVQVKTLLADKTASVLAGRYTLERVEAEPATVTTADVEGVEEERTGIRGLAIADDVTMVLVPDLITMATQDDGTIDLDTWKAVQTALITHCELHGGRMAILDPPPGLTPQQVKEWRAEDAMYDSHAAALYYPWITVSNPLATNGNKKITVPPSGHIAGLWSRVDGTRGVWKAPANEVLQGVLDVEPITQTEQGFLNPIGINCIRAFGTRGIRVWGARTLSSDTSWTYVPVRRLFNMIETTIEQGTQWAVFEPNDAMLWSKISRNVEAFLQGLWRDGALFGASSSQAFYVKCDAETNPPDSIDQGRVVAEIGIAPVKPAEFVIFRIAQIQGAAA